MLVSPETVANGSTWGVVMPSDVPSEARAVFVRPGMADRRGSLLLFGGVCGIGFAVLMFVVGLFGHPGLFALVASTTIPMLLSLSALAAGLTILRSPRRV